MGARRKGRESAVQMLYQWELTGEPVKKVLDSFKTLGEGSDASRDFARYLVEGTLAHREEIDPLIEAQAEKWRIERMSTVDRNILRVAVYELLFEPTPRTVVINEALEVTRRFSSEDAVAFVNGVLDGVRQKLEPAR